MRFLLFFLLIRIQDLTVVAIGYPSGLVGAFRVVLPLNLTGVAIFVTVVSDLFTVLQSEVNCHHVFKSAWVVEPKL